MPAFAPYNSRLIIRGFQKYVAGFEYDSWESRAIDTDFDWVRPAIRAFADSFVELGTSVTENVGREVTACYFGAIELIRQYGVLPTVVRPHGEIQVRSS